MKPIVMKPNNEITLQNKILIITSFFNPSKSDFENFMNNLNTIDYSNFSVFLINDGTEDDFFAKILNKNQNKKIEFFNFKKNKGINERYQWALEKANECDLIMFFDIDDEILPDSLSRINKIYSESKFDVLWFRKTIYNFEKQSICFDSLNELDNLDLNGKNFLKEKMEKILKTDLHLHNLKNKLSFDQKLTIALLAKNSSPRSKIYSFSFLEKLKGSYKNLFVDELLYRNHDFKLSYLAMINAKNIYISNSYFYKYKVNSFSSISNKNYYFELNHVIESLLIFFKKINKQKHPNNLNVFVTVVSIALMFNETIKNTTYKKIYIFFLKNLGKVKQKREIIKILKIISKKRSQINLNRVV